MVIAAPAAQAIQPDVDSQALEIARPDYALQLAPAHSAALATASVATAELGGQWSVYSWNPKTNTPRWLVGSGADLAAAEAAGDDAALAALSHDWASSRPALFRKGTAELVENGVVRGLGKVAVHFREEFHGIPVVDGFATMVYTDSGRLYAFGSDLHPDIDVPPVPLVSSSEAATIAKNGVPFDPDLDHVQGAPELVIVPVHGAEESAYHLAWRVRVTTTEPLGIWVTHVDAHTGSIIWRYNDVHFFEGSSYSGDVQADVEINTYCDGFTPNTALSDMNVTITNLGMTVTDTTGAFSIAGDQGSQTVEAEFNGPNLNVNNEMDPDAQYSASIDPNIPHAIYWDETNSDPSERDAFYWTNATKRYIQRLDSNWNYSKYTVNVNVNAACNANWGGTVMNFFRELGGCAATARIGDVVAHEFGHGIQFSLLGGQGAQGLGEGNGDITGTYMTDDPVIGRGFSLNNCASGIRNCDNNLVYPTHVIGQEIHAAGRVICGFNWDFRLEMEALLGPVDGKTMSGEIWHFARKVLRPSEQQPDQVLAYFIIDDDDGDLSNGTPHRDQICTAAQLHGFECPELIEGVVIQHTPLGDTMETGNDYEVAAAIFSTEGDLLLDSLRVFYRTDFGAMTQLLLQPEGTPNIFHAFIPAQQLGTLVQYYILGVDVIGNRTTSPEEAPGLLHTFFVGTLAVEIEDDMEIDSGWTVGPTTATSGEWERVDPNGVHKFIGGLPVEVTPEDDHTVDPGVMCWVTEQDDPGGFAGDHDVDNGFTTLASPSYDLSAEPYVRVEYWLWFSNELGANPAEDAFRFEISTDGGGTWSEVGSRLASTGSAWERERFEVSERWQMTSQVRFRFIAEDDQGGVNGPSLVEAGIDDFRVLVLPGAAAVSEPHAAAPLRFGLGQNQPNPFNPSTTIRFSLTAASGVTLRIYDTGGKLVRTLVDDRRAAGEHSAVWDGSDERGTAVASGIYYYRLDAGDRTRTRKMVLLK